MPIISAVIVTYFPEREPIENLLRSIATDIGHSYIVDNTPADSLGFDWISQLQSSSVSVTRLGLNKGLGFAQNLAIREIYSDGAEFVLLLDQDSVPQPDMIQKLVEAFRTVESRDAKIAAVGPCYVDVRQSNPPPFIRRQGLKLHRYSCDQLEEVCKVDYLISSGSLVPVSTWKAVGLIREDFFIDYLDIEWGLRAAQLGYQSYGVCAAKMQHSLGDQPVTFNGRQIPIHSPLRHYFHFRNATWLYFYSKLPIGWKLSDGLRLVRKLVFYTLFAVPRFRHLSEMLIGIVHGIVGRLGSR